MVIERQNIIDLIGDNKNKYSSCVICSYTFDFNYFEERILPELRSSNIRNINLFVDGNYFNHLLENNSSLAFKNHQSYSLNQVYSKGIFHPKIMLLTGPKHGLLIIGSGNLTSSGISTNDEIWGAFHINTLESPNAPLFAEVWKYLESIFPNAIGFNKQKINWIYHRAAWVNELSKLRNKSFFKINEDSDLAFISNNEQSIFERLITLIPKGNLNELNIVSPYIDSKTEAIEGLVTYFNPAKVNVITDSEFGILPAVVSTKINNRTNLYDWKDCLDNFDNRFNRLHAKIFQFKFNDGTEYLLIGSANATIAAIGNNSKTSINHEAGVLLRSVNGVDTVKQLGINWSNAKTIDLEKVKQQSYNNGDKPYLTQSKIILKHAEIDGAKLSITLKKEIKENLVIIIEDSFEQVSERVNVNVNSSEIIVELVNPEKAAIVYVSKSSEKVSNKCIIHNVSILAKCNPDPNQIELNNIISSLETNPDGDQYIELLKYADYNWVEAEIDNTKQKSIKTGSSKRIKQQDREYKTLSSEEFESLDSLQQIEQRILNDPTTQIADILQIVTSGLTLNKDDVNESDEESIISLAENERTGEGKAVSNNIGRTRGKEVEEVISQHLKKVRKYYKFRLEELTKKRTFHDTPKEAITVKDCSHLSIAVDLMYLFQGKQYSSYTTEFSLKYNKDDSNKLHELVKRYKLTKINKTSPDILSAVYYSVNQEWFKDLLSDVKKMLPKTLIEVDEYPTLEKNHQFIRDGYYTKDKISGIKGMLIETIGAFIICSNEKAGFKEYDYSTLNNKIISLRTTIAEKTLFLLCNLNWKENELIYQKLIGLNILNFIYPEKKIDANNLISKLSRQRGNSNKINPNIERNLQFLNINIIEPYLGWKMKYDKDKTQLLQPTSDLQYGDIVYNMKFGFTLVSKYRDSSLTIISPGMEWNENIKHPSIDINYTQSKIIGF